jgi:hypothetical protein
MAMELLCSQTWVKGCRWLRSNNNGEYSSSQAESKDCSSIVITYTAMFSIFPRFWAKLDGVQSTDPAEMLDDACQCSKVVPLHTNDCDRYHSPCQFSAEIVSARDA